MISYLVVLSYSSESRRRGKRRGSSGHEIGIMRINVQVEAQVWIFTPVKEPQVLVLMDSGSYFH